MMRLIIMSMQSVATFSILRLTQPLEVTLGPPGGHSGQVIEAWCGFALYFLLAESQVSSSLLCVCHAEYVTCLSYAEYVTCLSYAEYVSCLSY